MDQRMWTYLKLLKPISKLLSRNYYTLASIEHSHSNIFASVIGGKLLIVVIWIFILSMLTWSVNDIANISPSLSFAFQFWISFWYTENFYIHVLIASFENSSIGFITSTLVTQIKGKFESSLHKLTIKLILLEHMCSVKQGRRKKMTCHYHVVTREWRPPSSCNPGVAGPFLPSSTHLWAAVESPRFDGCDFCWDRHCQRPAVIL